MRAANELAKSGGESVDQIVRRLAAMPKFGSDYLSEISVGYMINEALRFDHHPRLVYLEILLHGKGTAPEITRRTTLSRKAVDSALQELSLHNSVITENAESGSIVYSPNVHRFKLLDSQEVFPSGPRVPLIYQFNLISDKRRMGAFTRAIREVITQGDVVADLGAGVGTLSLTAARNARVVYSVEVDPVVYSFGKRLTSANSRINFLLGDARTISLPEPVDVFVCEMMDTALIAELQVPVMNHAVSKLGRGGASVIPLGASTELEVIEKDFWFRGNEFRLPHFEAYGSRRGGTRLTGRKEIHSVDFREENPTTVRTKIRFKATRAGSADALRLVTTTALTRDVSLESSDWYCPPLVLPLPALKVVQGDAIDVMIRYQLGGGMESLRYHAEKA
jgi:predicted RNA methylase